MERYTERLVRTCFRRGVGEPWDREAAGVVGGERVDLSWLELAIEILFGLNPPPSEAGLVVRQLAPFQVPHGHVVSTLAGAEDLGLKLVAVITATVVMAPSLLDMGKLWILRKSWMTPCSHSTLVIFLSSLSDGGGTPSRSDHGTRYSL
jgi:hypothetical protein